METFNFYFSLGFQHVTDFNGLDHFYFIIALALPFGFKQAQKLLWWVTLFTLGHSLSLIGNYYASVAFSAYWIELLIPVTIALSCLPILVQQTPKTNGYASGLTLLFGIIHGFGFGRFFSMMVAPEDAGTSLFSFALGLEAAQIAIVLCVLLLNFIIAMTTKWLRLWRTLIGIVIFLLAVIMIVERI
ncbi:HupE/UreJ family protein [Flavobacteriaceae bacterium]|nr:HupE/UreJ family protein [Flavobacteriaceae bacterium]